MKVWVMAMETIKIVKVRGEVMFKRVEEIDKRRIEIRLMWMPGIKPVIVPAIRPRRIARIIGSSII